MTNLADLPDMPVRDAATGAYLHLPDAGGWKDLRCLQCPPPHCPEKVCSAGIEGDVRLVMTVTAEGKPEKIVLLQGLGRGLDERVFAAMKKWKLRPASGPGGKPVTVRAIVEFAFRLVR